ncbi:MAG: response regulator [Phenylobacterium sp.]|uniref:response regulator n=1 Tax=Phenylobacterium sp. SCN 70-31 TaxID=1660129 RepID=UPI00086E63CE|nr:response regulator [Phenylobacterium sp. SCN 70-31]MCW5759811.1 response regulator [Phenylobacterium sp.]ODT87625.1 MAG: hypothetical protein ABS78_10745 [Phenylobacterium sp. SCN 70-31]
MHIQTGRADAVPLSVRVDAFRDLCASYDPLLKPGAAPVDEEDRAALETFARLFDVPTDPDVSDGDLWRQVRPLLAQQFEAERAGAPPSAPTGKVFLPSNQGAAEAKGLAAPAPPLALLVVEDDPDLSASIVEALTDAGHLVVATASTAAGAAVLAGQHAIDFAILDVELDGADDGVALARDLYARWNLKALFISGGPNAHLVELDVALGFVGKPFTAAELLAAVTLASGLISRRAA